VFRNGHVVAWQVTEITNYDIKWFKMYDTGRKLDKDILSSAEVVKIDGVDYHIGRWIRNNVQVFCDNKMNEDRLTLCCRRKLVIHRPTG
jgi:hypothetical protein